MQRRRFQFAFVLVTILLEVMASFQLLAQDEVEQPTKATTEHLVGEEKRAAAEHSLIVAGYIPDYQLAHWSGDANSLTDLIYFGASVSKEGRFDPGALSTEHAQVLKKAKAVSHCRLLLAVGGWNRSGGFGVLVPDAKLRGQFINEVKAYCLKHGFDGIDFDWEHPRAKHQIDSYAKLLRETRDAFAGHKLIVTVAIPGWLDLGKDAFAAVDRVHLMSYDHEFPHATMEKSKADVDRLLKAGCPAGKIVLGIPFYGRNKDGRTLSYAELTKGKTLADNEDIVDGYALNGRATVAIKVRFAREAKLAGVMIWELEQDAPTPSSLLKAIGKEAKGGS